MNKLELQKMAVEVRKGIVTGVHSAKSGHPGGSLSAADIFTYLFFEELNIDPKNPDKADRDRFVLSKGHTAPGYYAALANRGFFPVEDLTTLRHVGSYLQGHPDKKHIPGVDMSSGSLGQLRFVVLYRSEDNRLESFTDSINFGEKIFMDEVEERDTVNLSGDLEDLNISAINSRKLAVRALLGIHAVCEVPVEEEIVSGVENDPDIQQKSRTMQLLALTSAKKDILRVHSDIALPQSSPNIGHLLYDYVEVRNRQVICTGEQMQIQGEAYVNVLYSSPEGKMEWYETMVPFSESIEGGMTGTQPICWVHCQTKEYEVEPAEDYDGEMRALSLNLSMDVEMKLWEERNVELLADVYSLETNLVPQKEMVCAKKLLIKNEAKLRISEQMKLAEEQERILQLCSFEGHAEMDHVEPVENGLEVEGILTVDILYATTDDSFPIAHTQEQIPFTQIVDVPGMKGHTEDISYEIEPAIDQLAVNLLDNERFEVKAVISLQTIVQQEVCMEKIVDIHKEPLDAVELMKQPGIVGYIVKKEEQLWDIARHFHTTEAEIMETNGLKSADVQQGDKLLIVKKVSEC